ncbi:hypothetical protein INN71_12990 [Nocardioides sp. ChNu-153]|uniref:DMP19 family protein n=1 Tax=unclassified Nocardioides TaxID=2615069 RepID=UPI0024064B29|nr:MULTISPECIES: hypothetical protein [unclassified Nocardioides]MDF9715036.1 hypothetical protein [Nocardioides sp. ChNu-99]MDN7122305.1 hypothetical protein [Nocardioides sp. ChNu-153]
MSSSGVPGLPGPSVSPLDRAIDYYDDRVGLRESLEDDAARRRWDLGAVAVIHGLIGNGGLVGAIENCVETDVEYVTDGIVALRSLGLDQVADLVDRAFVEYRRMRPNSCSDDLSPADDALWEELDEAYWAVSDDVEHAISARASALPD